MKRSYSSRRRITIFVVSSVICLLGPDLASAEETFKNPTVNGYALDYCRNWAENCGWPAAHAYCKSKGYAEATAYRWRQDNPPTRVIKGGQLCTQPTCDRITSVTCTYSQRID
jgi:hypothetical protein